MKMPFLLISPKNRAKNPANQKGGCFEYHVIADKIEYRYLHRASICPALGIDRRFYAQNHGQYKRDEQNSWKERPANRQMGIERV